STGSGTATGNGALLGLSSLGFAPAGTLIGAGAVVGISSLTFTPSGTELGAESLVGETNIAFACSRTLRAAGALAGTATLAFAPSATVTGTSAIISGAGRPRWVPLIPPTWPGLKPEKARAPPSLGVTATARPIESAAVVSDCAVSCGASASARILL